MERNCGVNQVIWSVWGGIFFYIESSFILQKRLDALHMCVACSELRSIISNMDEEVKNSWIKKFCTWIPSKKFSPMITTVCPPVVQPSLGETAFTCGTSVPGYKPRVVIHRSEMSLVSNTYMTISAIHITLHALLSLFYSMSKNLSSAERSLPNHTVVSPLWSISRLTFESLCQIIISLTHVHILAYRNIFI